MIRLTDAPSAFDVLGPEGRLGRTIPGYQPRPSQIAMAQRLLEAIEDREHVVVEAPTGTGKSFAYLVPIALSGKRAIVSTATKVLQDQIDSKDAPMLADAVGHPVSVVTLKGTSNYVCRIEMEQPETVRDGEFSLEEWAAFSEWTHRSPTGDLERYALEARDLGIRSLPLTAKQGSAVTTTAAECLGKECSAADRCFLRQARSRAKSADIVLVNHALLLQDTVTDYRLLPPADIIVVDEAHHLEDWATKIFGVEVWFNRWSSLSKRIGKLAHVPVAAVEALQRSGRTPSAENVDRARRGERLETALGDVTVRMMTVFGDAAGWFAKTKSTQLELEDETVTGIAARSAMWELFERMCFYIETDLETDKETGTVPWLDETGNAKWVKHAQALRKLFAELQTCLADDAGQYVRYAEINRRLDDAEIYKVRLHAKPVIVAPILAEALFGRMDPDGRPVPVLSCSATIATAGTLAAWREAVGMEDGDSLILPSPFDFVNQMRIYVPPMTRAASLDPSSRQRDGAEAYFTALAKEMLALVRASKGGAFFLFTSFQALEEVYIRLITDLKYEFRTVLRQGGEQGRPKAELLDAFTRDKDGVLFGTKSFWEGVDIAGAALRLVVIDKLPFPSQMDAVIHAREERIRRNGGSPFGDLMLPYAELALKQGVGRLIRRTTDRGVAAILDGRLRTKGYGVQLLRALPASPVIETATEVERWLAN